MLATHAQIMQIPVAYSTRIELLFQHKIMNESSLIMEGRFQGIFGAVLFVTRTETAIIIVFIDSPQAYQAVDCSFCKFRLASFLPCLFHYVKRFLKCVGRITCRGSELMRHMLPAYYTMM